MTRSPLARRYARALFELAQEQDRLGVVRQDLAALAPLAADRPQFLLLVQAFAARGGDRARSWSGLLDGRVDPLTLRFVLFLARKGRATLLPDAIQEFEALYYEARGVQTVEIHSAHPMREDQVQALVSRFSEKLGREVRAVTRVVPALLGGFQVRAGDMIYDYSIHHQLELMHRNMRTA